MKFDLDELGEMWVGGTGRWVDGFIVDKSLVV